MGSEFVLHRRSDGVVYGECGAIWVMTLHAKPTVADMEMSRPSLQRMRERHPDGFPTLTWVLPSAGVMMDADARDAAALITREHSSSLLAMATLVEGEGFAAAAVRAIVAGIDFLSRAKAPKKTFAELGPAIRWCSELRAPRDRAGDIEPIVSSLAAMRKLLD